MAFLPSAAWDLMCCAKGEFFKKIHSVMPYMIREGGNSVPPPPTFAVSGGSVFFCVWGLFPHNLLLERDAVVGGDTHDVDACGEA